MPSTWWVSVGLFVWVSNPKTMLFNRRHPAFWADSLSRKYRCFEFRDIFLWIIPFFIWEFAVLVPITPSTYKRETIDFMVNSSIRYKIWIKMFWTDSMMICSCYSASKRCSVDSLVGKIKSSVQSWSAVRSSVITSCCASWRFGWIDRFVLFVPGRKLTNIEQSQLHPCASQKTWELR